MFAIVSIIYPRITMVIFWLVNTLILESAYKPSTSIISELRKWTSWLCSKHSICQHQHTTKYEYAEQPGYLIDAAGYKQPHNIYSFDHHNIILYIKVGQPPARGPDPAHEGLASGPPPCSTITLQSGPRNSCQTKAGFMSEITSRECTNREHFGRPREQRCTLRRLLIKYKNSKSRCRQTNSNNYNVGLVRFGQPSTSYA